jgi:hypothetical protein
MPPTEHNGIRYRDLPDPRRYDNPAERIRSGLFFVGAFARRLADDIERMERTDKRYPEALNGHYYIASNADDPTKLEDPFEPRGEDVDDDIKQTIESMFTLRLMAKTARELIESDGAFMDGAGESADRRWTTRAIRQVRAVRNSALYAHALDLYPSALPMLHKGVATHLRKTAAGLEEFIVVAQTVVVPPALIGSGKSGPAEPVEATPAVLRDPLFVSHQKDGVILAQLQRRDPVPQRQADLLGLGDIPGAHLLSARLKALEDAGMVKSAANRSGYVITPLGKNLLGDIQAARTRG